MWEYHNGKIPKGYHVHHKDGNTANNDISNLELIEGCEHMSMHMREKMQDPKFVVELTKRMDYARIFANKWHGSPEGIEWHRKHGIEVAEKIEPVKFICEYCGKEFMSKPNGTNRFCSNKCKTAARYHSGIDNEVRICSECGKEFVANKYASTKYCSKRCSGKVSARNRYTKK